MGPPWLQWQTWLFYGSPYPWGLQWRKYLRITSWTTICRVGWWGACFGNLTEVVEAIKQFDYVFLIVLSAGTVSGSTTLAANTSTPALAPLPEVRMWLFDGFLWGLVEHCEATPHNLSTEASESVSAQIGQTLKMETDCLAFCTNSMFNM